MTETNTANIGFEKEIWDAACILRGNIENLRLAALRDTLLPRLMSGEIDVSEVEV